MIAGEKTYRELEAEVARLREALEQIQQQAVQAGIVGIARRALEGK